MNIFLYMLSVIAFMIGFAILIFSRSAIHEIQAYILFLIAAVLFSSAAIVTGISGMRDQLPKRSPVRAPAPEVK